MSEIFPRFDLPELNFLTVDATANEQRIIGKYEELTGRTLANGDPVRLFLLSLAAESTMLRQAFNLAARQNLLSYATGDHLDALGEMVNTQRITAQKSVVTLRFNLNTAQSGVYAIPAGTRVSDGTTMFATNELAEIPEGETTIDVVATSTVEGSYTNNIKAGAINTVVDLLPNLESVENINQPSGGADTETDEAYAQRIHLAPGSFSVAGPHDSYEYYCRKFSAAIIDCSIYGLPEHAGNVYVHPLLTGGTLPTETFVSELKNYLSADDIRPLTDNVLVSAPQAVAYTINLKWFLNTSDVNRISQVTSAVVQAVEEYRQWQQTKIGRDLNPDELIKRIRNAGAKRVEITSPVFTEVTKSQVAQCPASDVTITYGGVEDE